MKDLKISKELLSEVLAVEISGFEIIGNILNYVIPNYETEEDGDLIYIDLGQNINIYELAFRCKEWAYKNEYDIWSITWGAVEFQNNEKYNGTERIKKDTEIEAIIKACEWILNNKEGI